MFDKTFFNLEHSMKLMTAKQEMHAHNIANINTPDYQPLEFDAVLEKVVKSQDKKNASLEREMAGIAENGSDYSAAVKLITEKFNVLKTVASQGKR